MRRKFTRGSAVTLNRGSHIIGGLEKEAGKDYENVILDVSLPACCLYEKLGYHTIRHEQMFLINGVGNSKRIVPGQRSNFSLTNQTILVKVNI